MKNTYQSSLQTIFFAMMILMHSLLPSQVRALQKDSYPMMNGPMVGSVTMRSAKIWVQFPQLQIKESFPTWIEYAPLFNDPRDQTSPKLLSEKLVINTNKNNGIWEVSDLDPGTTYQYWVVRQKGNRLLKSPPYQLKTETLWQWRTNPPPLKIVASSCAYTNDAPDDRPGKPYGQGNTIFETMANSKPDVTLWMGDNIYLREPDFGNPKSMAKRYEKWRSLPQLQPLLQTGSHIATWDDHDYGENDSNSSNPFKQVALELFKSNWPNPSFGIPGLQGVFTQYKSSDVEFFILDDRWYRDNEKLMADSKQMYGPDQMRWLKNALLTSTATWKLIVSGSQILNLDNKYEGWHHFEKESNEFLSWLERQKIPGVLLMSGDRHFSVLIKKERDKTYPLYELTCSPSTAGPYSTAYQEVQNNPTVIKESVVTTNNFCELSVDGKLGNRQLQIVIKDANGKNVFMHSISQAELK